MDQQKKVSIKPMTAFKSIPKETLLAMIPTRQELMVKQMEEEERKDLLAMEEEIRGGKKEEEEEEDEGGEFGQFASEMTEKLKKQLAKMGYNPSKERNYTKQDICIELMARHGITYKQAEGMWRQGVGDSKKAKNFNF